MTLFNRLQLHLYWRVYFPIVSFLANYLINPINSLYRKFFEVVFENHLAGSTTARNT